jgi:predicted N-formylglutamate amidohydrolase
MKDQWHGLLAKDEPSPVVWVNDATTDTFLLTGDHAGNRIPRALGDLGLGAADRGRHIAVDRGVAALGTALACRLDAPFVHQCYSRLVIDCNRAPDSAEAMPEVADGTVVSGNSGLTAAARALRIAEVHAPYHAAISGRIAAARRPPVFVALHSFTPVLAGRHRPWHVGVLHGGGAEAYALRLLAALRRQPDWVVGDNAPYRFDATDYSVPCHAFPAGLSYAEIEVRQDLLATAAGVAMVADLLAAGLVAALDPL